MGRAGFSGSMLSGVTYISKWGSILETRKRAMARILIPSPGLKVSPTQGENSPFFSRSLPRDFERAVSRSRSSLIRTGKPDFDRLFEHRVFRPGKERLRPGRP